MVAKPFGKEKGKWSGEKTTQMLGLSNKVLTENRDQGQSECFILQIQQSQARDLLDFLMFGLVIL